MRRMKKLPDEFFIGRKLKCYICGTKSRQVGEKMSDLTDTNNQTIQTFYTEYSPEEETIY